MATRSGLNLDVDLQRGVVPISKAASSLAALIKRASVTGQPVIVTQKGYPTGVLLPVELFAALKALADGQDAPEASPALTAEIDEAPAGEVAPPVAAPPAAEPPTPGRAPKRRSRGAAVPTTDDA